MNRLENISVIFVICNKDIRYIHNAVESIDKSATEAKIKTFYYIFQNSVKINNNKLDKYNYKLFFSDINIGYGLALDKILKKIKGNWCIIANPDTITDRLCFSNLQKYFDPSAAIIAPMVISNKNVIQTTILEEPSLYQIFLEQSSLSKSLGVLKILFKNFLVPKGITPIRFSEASWWLINKSKCLKSGGFDRNFFLYFEDIDLCKRISRYGRIIYNPFAKVIHYGHQSNDGMVIPEKYIESLAYYLNKYHSLLYTKICMLVVLAGSFLRLVFWLLLSLFNRGEISSRKIQYYRVIITETLHIII